MSPKIPVSSFLIACGIHLLIGTTVSLQAGSATRLQEVGATQKVESREGSGPVALFPFEGAVGDVAGAPVGGILRGEPAFTRGLEGRALHLGPGSPPTFLRIDRAELPFGYEEDFSVQFWMRSVEDSDRQFVVLSQKGFPEKSLESQKGSGWVFYVSGGTWAWNMGSGDRRITYERENGKSMPLNDGRWHQLTMTYSSARSEIRLFYDGVNWVWYKVRDSEGFDFTNSHPLVVGWDREERAPGEDITRAIKDGAQQLQALVDAFNGFGLADLESNEFVHLIVDPRRLFDQKVEARANLLGADSLVFREAMSQVDWEPMAELEAGLMDNPYTVHQVLNFMDTAPLMEVYELVDGTVTIRTEAAKAFTGEERLDAPSFDMDNLAVWDRVLSPEEVLNGYAKHFEPSVGDLEDEVPSLNAGSWNIWHGGRHFTVDEHGWDSRVAIADIIEREAVDIVMMQETYSAGDFIAAELGYYFATTVDWDYLNQGSNISVLSRYPIEELHVEEDSPFMNVGVKIGLSRTQDLYAVSNWYGMDQFPAVFEFHEPRFRQSDSIPTLFAGDFNAVPHTDGGDSPASRVMLDAGFTDAYRSLHPDVDLNPGFTHRSGSRIDQLYYKGRGLRNTSTRVISTWPAGFPSDHFLILASFDLGR